MKQRPLTMEALHRRFARIHRAYGAPSSREIREHQKAMDAEYIRLGDIAMKEAKEKGLA
jgi:hypothetical protein